MSRAKLLSARGFSLGTKLILIALAIETVMLATGMVLAYSFLTEMRMNEFEQLLFSQSDLIAREVQIDMTKPELIGSRLVHLDLSLEAHYQVVDSEGRVIWDSQDRTRDNAQIMGAHWLFEVAKKSAIHRGTIDYSQPRTSEHFLGAYRRIGEDYIILGAISRDEIRFGIERTLERFVYLAFLMYGLSILVLIYFTRQIINPVHALTEAAEKISYGDFDIRLGKTANDEIGMLSETFLQMNSRIRLLLEGEVQKMRIEQEVGSVAELQRLLLPPPIVHTDRYEIVSFYQSATETGGDYWGYLETRTHLIIFVGDATGHGLPSAMMTAAARGCFSAIHEFYRSAPDALPSLEKFLEFANLAVLDVSKGMLQMTLFAAMISFEDRTLTYANAGHQAAYLLRAKTGEIETLRGRGTRLGESENFKSSPAKTVGLETDDLLFLYSDGLSDLENDEGEPLGKSVIKQKLKDGLKSGLSLVQMREQMETLAATYRPHDLPEDDIMFALLRYKR